MPDVNQEGQFPQMARLPPASAPVLEPMRALTLHQRAALPAGVRLGVQPRIPGRGTVRPLPSPAMMMKEAESVPDAAPAMDFKSMMRDILKGVQELTESAATDHKAQSELDARVGLMENSVSSLRSSHEQVLQRLDLLSASLLGTTNSSSAGEHFRPPDQDPSQGGSR